MSMFTTLDKLQYLFSKIDWNHSFLDADAVRYMNELPGEIRELQALTLKAFEQLKGARPL